MRGNLLEDDPLAPFLRLAIEADAALASGDETLEQVQADLETMRELEAEAKALEASKSSSQLAN